MTGDDDNRKAAADAEVPDFANSPCVSTIFVSD